MAYIHERNYGCRISSDYTYRGLKTIIMENEKLRISILADKGTDIFEFLYKPCDVDFLWRSPIGVRNPGLNVPTISTRNGSFLDYYEGGWYAITNTKKKVEFGLHWPKGIFPYLWFWQDYQGEFGYPLYGRTYVVALEPFTSYPRFGLEEAIKRGTQMKLAKGESVEVELKAVAYEGIERVKWITEEGEIQ